MKHPVLIALSEKFLRKIFRPHVSNKRAVRRFGALPGVNYFLILLFLFSAHSYSDQVRKVKIFPMYEWGWAIEEADLFNIPSDYAGRILSLAKGKKILIVAATLDSKWYKIKVGDEKLWVRTELIFPAGKIKNPATFKVDQILRKPKPAIPPYSYALSFIAFGVEGMQTRRLLMGVRAGMFIIPRRLLLECSIGYEVLSEQLAMPFGLYASYMFQVGHKLEVAPSMGFIFHRDYIMIDGKWQFDDETGEKLTEWTFFFPVGGMVVYHISKFVKLRAEFFLSINQISKGFPMEAPIFNLGVSYYF